MTKEEKAYHEAGRSVTDSIESQMFGKPCYKIGKKAFCCFFENEMVFKLTGEMHQEALSYDGSQLFDPSKKGRAMKEWVQVAYDYQEQWPVFAKSAAAYLKGE